MSNIKKTILNLAVLALMLSASKAGAQIWGTATEETLANGSTVYLTATPQTSQNDDWRMENNIAMDADGNTYVVGTYKADPNNQDWQLAQDTDIFIRKILPSGAVGGWTVPVANVGNDYGRGVALDGAGNVYALGVQTVSGIEKIVVAKFNMNSGAQVWAATPVDGTAYDIVADGSFAYVTGSTNNKIAILKYAAADGVSTSANFNSGDFYSAAYSIDLRDNFLALAGFVYNPDTYSNDIWVGKFNATTLANVWASTYTPVNQPQYNTDEAHAVKIDAAGNIYAAGFYYSYDSGQDIWLGKYDASGNLVFAKTKNGPSNGYDKAFGLALDPFGNVYVTGKTEAYNIGQGDNIWLGKYSPSGALLSEVTANRDYEVGYDVEVSSWMVVVGGGFNDKYGLLNVYPEQFGAPQPLFAGPGFNTGSVNLSWAFEVVGTANFKIQYSTYTDNFPWSISAPGNISGVANVYTPGQTFSYNLMGLPVRQNFAAGQAGTTAGGTGPMAAVPGPVYYFKVWVDGVLLNTVPANSAPNAPYSYMMRNGMGQDSLNVFDGARVPSVGMVRDAAGNTFTAYAAGYGMSQGLAISKVNQNGDLEWTSFYNSSSANGSFNANRMILDAAGNIYVAGTVSFEGSGTSEEAWLAKFNPAGVKIWDRIMSGPGSDQFTGLALNGAGTVVYAAGALTSASDSSKDMVVAKYDNFGTLITSATYNYNMSGQDTAPSEIWGLAVDGTGNLYAGGSISQLSGSALDRDTMVLKLDPSLVVLSSHAFANANPPSGIAETHDGIMDLAFDGGSLYASGVKSNGDLAQFWAARLNPSDWAAPVWEKTYSGSGMPAAAYGLKINAGSLYVVGFELRETNKNVLLRKYNIADGTLGWTKSLNSMSQGGGSSLGFAVEVGADAFFYVSGIYNMWGMDSVGQPGVARLAEPVVGIAAMTGPKPCSVQLSWVADTELPAGTQFFVKYATYPLANFSAPAEQYAFTLDNANFSGAYISRLVPGLEAGTSASAQGQWIMDSPRYYFRMAYDKGLGLVEIDASTSAVANAPGTGDRMDRYPNGNLYVINNAHGEKFPLLRDAAGNIYTAGSVNSWGWNSNAAYVRKSNPAGQQLWTRYYSDEFNNSNPVINALALDAAGNLYAAGTTGSDSSSYNPNNNTYGMESLTKKDVLLIKYNSSGRMLWQRSYNIAMNNLEGSNDLGYGLALGPLNIFLAGTFRGADYIDQAFVMALDANGVVSSSVTYSGSGMTAFSGLDYDAVNGRLFAAGKANNNGVIKVFNDSLADQSLDIIVNKGESEDEIYAVKADTVNAAVYLAGAVDSGMGMQDAYLAKFDANALTGSPLWERTYNSANENNDEAYGLALDGLGGVYLSGSEFRYDLNQGKNIFVRKYSVAEGDLIWSQVLNSAGNNEDTAGGIAADSVGNVYAAVDAAQMGAIAGGTTMPGTYNAGNTANTANTINGSGYFRHTQFSMITTNPRLTVRVNRVANQGLQGVSVAVMSFNQTGGMDPNGINYQVTDASGAVTFPLPANRGYMVAISSHNMVPTISEQISDPNGNFFVELNANTTKQYYISYRPATADPVNKMTIHFDGLNAGEFVMGEVAINNTGEKVAYGIIKATGTKSTMEIFNIGAAANGVYSMAVNVPARNKAMQLFMNGDFPFVNYYEANINNAMSMATGFEVGGSTNPPSVTGMVNDANFSPLEGARVRIEKYACTGTEIGGICVGGNYQPVFNKESLTDVSGRYNFYGVPVGNGYNLNVGKSGYESAGSMVNIPVLVPGTAPVPYFVETFQLALATYTLTGVLKYNGMPLPNAMIMVYGDMNGYSQSPNNDSYRMCQYGGCGLRSDARVRTGADGSFTLSGLTDGNARIQASFEGGMRSLNEGNSSSMSDNIRVTISSQGATGPSSPPNNPCRPGRTWVLNSSGTCVTAGSVVFNIVPEGGNDAGRLYGKLTFITTYTVTENTPLVISTSAPLTLMAQQSCNNGCQNTQMGFTSLAGTFNTNTTNYAILLSTGVTYYPRVFSSAWAKASTFDSEVSPTTESPSVRQDMSVVRSGGVHGVLKFPDGSNFKPVWGDGPTSYSLNLEIRGVNVDVSEGKSPDENGEFDFPNLAPGTYKIITRPQGGGFIWAPPIVESLSVTEGRTTEVKMQLETGLAVKPQIFGLPAVSTAAWGYFIIGVESGEEMTQKKISDLFFNEPKYSFDYSTSTGWGTKYMPAGQYDFYLMLGSKYEPAKGGGSSSENPESYHQFANFIGRVKGMSVQKDASNPAIGTAAQPIAINILGATGQANISGTVNGSKVFTPPDLERMFGNFNETFNLIPAIMLYDTAGDLRGFASAFPNKDTFEAFEIAMMARDVPTMLDYMAANGLDYGIWGLPPGRYTAVFANPNYPPMAKEITLPDNAAYNFNFDDQHVITGVISGVVKSSATGQALEGARVYLKHRTVEKFTQTDSSGAFSISNLPAGIYRLEVTRNGYVTAGEKTGLSGNDSAAFNMYLLPSESKLSGRLFMSKFPAPVTRAGVQLVAYDETRNVEFPSSYLPKTEVQTDASGNYEITGVIPGHLYKLSAFFPGKLPEVLAVTAEEGNTVVNDITLKDTPPQIAIKVKKSGDSINKVDVVIKSPKQLISIPNCQYNPGRPFSADSAVTLALVPGPGNTYLGQFTVSSNQPLYTVRVTAGDGSNKMVKDFEYDQASTAKSEQYIQQESLAGGEVQMDKETEEYSGIELDPGALSYAAAPTGAVDYSNLVGGFFSALPSVRTVKTAKGNLSVTSAIQSLMASEIYNMDLSNASANKPFTLTLKYDKERGSGSRNLRIHQYDEATGTWLEVPGNYTVDPMTGVVSVDVASLTNAYEGTSGASTPLGRKRFGMSAVVNGRYVPSTTASTSQSGRFAVFTANPPTGTAAFSSSLEIYNMPNPFNLKSKSVTLSGDVGSSGITNPYPTNGTVIKYNLPTGKTGSLKFVIYNMAGEKVRTIDEGARTGGQLYYSEWDGKNDTNQDCASGVYFMLTYLDGKKLGNKAHKLAIIK